MGLDINLRSLNKGDTYNSDTKMGFLRERPGEIR